MKRLHDNTAWKSYDKSFRKLTESLELAWQKAVEVLRAKCISMSQKQNYGQPFLGKTASKALFCFTFNQGGCKNTPCPYSRPCQICSCQHPKIKCSPPTNELVIQEIPKPVKWDKLDKEFDDNDEE